MRPDYEGLEYGRKLAPDEIATPQRLARQAAPDAQTLRAERATLERLLFSGFRREPDEMTMTFTDAPEEG